MWLPVHTIFNCQAMVKNSFKKDMKNNTELYSIHVYWIYVCKCQRYCM